MAIRIAIGLMLLFSAAGYAQTGRSTRPDDLPYIDAAMGTGMLTEDPASVTPRSSESDGFDAFFEKIFSKDDAGGNASAPTASSVPNAAAECARVLHNGLVLTGDYPPIDYPHQLTIQNKHGSPAVVKLLNLQTRQRTLFYVGAGQTASLANIPDGTYNIAYASGGHLAADCETVIRPDATMVFPGPQTFTTKIIGDQVETAELSYTLFRVPNGNVKPKPISVAAFNAD